MIGLLKKIGARLAGGAPDWDGLEEDMIRADLGARFAAEFVDALRKDQGALAAGHAANAAKARIRRLFGNPAPPALAEPLHVILMAGVNGVGKTTTCAKLARRYAAQGHRVRLAAADTFRAAAVEQLRQWGGRLDIPVTHGAEGADSAAVAFRAAEEARAAGERVLIVDTAGRQHTRGNLMQELAKVARVVGKACPGAPHEALLVIDAATGANAVAQAREFGKAVPLTGIAAAKLDGSGTGGALVAIQAECGLPPLWAGTGEGPDDLAPFDVERYLHGLFAGG